MDKGVKVALIVALVVFLVARDVRITLLAGGAALGADVLL